MNKETAKKIFQGVFMFYDLNAKVFIMEKLGMSRPEIEFCSRLFRDLRFTELLKEVNEQ